MVLLRQCPHRLLHLTRGPFRPHSAEPQQVVPDLRLSVKHLDELLVAADAISAIQPDQHQTVAQINQFEGSYLVSKLNNKPVSRLELHFTQVAAKQLILQMQQWLGRKNHAVVGLV